MKIEVWARPFWQEFDDKDALMMSAIRSAYPLHTVRMYGRSHQWLKTPKMFAPLEVFYASLIDLSVLIDDQNLLETLWAVDFNSTQMLAARWHHMDAGWSVSPSMQLHYFGGLVTLEVVVHLDYAKLINYAEN